jgi:hypothetical protein
MQSYESRVDEEVISDEVGGKWATDGFCPKMFVKLHFKFFFHLSNLLAH